MRDGTDRPNHEPIVEPWRFAALALIVAVAMLVVHAIEPADARISDRGQVVVSADH